jgi:hypothetical protein
VACAQRTSDRRGGGHSEGDPGAAPGGHNLDEIAWKPVSRSESTTLGYFIADYVGHLEHHLAQIRERLAGQG